MADIELFFVWLMVIIAVFILLYNICTAIEEKARGLVSQLPEGRVRDFLAWTAGGAMACLIIVILFHPLFVTYPKLFMSEAAEVQSDGTLRHLPFGAVDAMVDGPIVRLTPMVGCHVTTYVFTQDGLTLQTVLPWPLYFEFRIRDYDTFYRSFGSREKFCTKVDSVISEEVKSRIQSGITLKQPYTDSFAAQETLTKAIETSLREKLPLSSIELKNFR